MKCTDYSFELKVLILLYTDLAHPPFNCRDRAFNRIVYPGVLPGIINSTPLMRGAVFDHNH